MPKGKKQQIVYCVEHDFNLIPMRNDLYFKHNVYVSFCSGKATQVEKSRSKKIKKRESDDEDRVCLKCPIFNRDKNPGTSAFILNDQQKDYFESFDDLLKDHNKKVNNFNLNLDEKSKIMIPKPKTKYSYCNVCRCNYQEYLIHTRSEPHKANLRKSLFTKHIKELENKYKKQRVKQIRERKIVNWSGQPTQPSLDDDVIEIKGIIPTKRVKTQIKPGYEDKQQNINNFSQNPFVVPQMVAYSNFDQNINHNYPLTLALPPIYPLASFQQLRYTQYLSKIILNQQITQNILQNIEKANMILGKPQNYQPHFYAPNQNMLPFYGNNFDQNIPTMNNRINTNPLQVIKLKNQKQLKFKTQIKID